MKMDASHTQQGRQDETLHASISLEHSAARAHSKRTKKIKSFGADLRCQQPTAHRRPSLPPPSRTLP